MRLSLTALFGALVLSACAAASESDDATTDSEALSGQRLNQEVQKIIRDNALTGAPGASVRRPSQDLVELGTLLFFDKILGGEQNQACVSCHHPLTGTGDALRLSRGVGSTGVGVARTRGPGALIPRNAPPVWNGILFDVQFWDGRVTRDAQGVVHSPDGITTDVNTALAAQAEFPVTSDAEMRGTFMPGASNQALRDALAKRVAAIGAYADRFEAVFGDRDVTYTRIAEALAAYETSLMPLDTPWFSYVRGDSSAISASAKRGALVFYEKAKCSGCHAGDLMTDMAFHNIGLPQFGPGKGDGADKRDDYGRERVTGKSEDRYKFRTPTLINVDLHGPFGHDGAYEKLGSIVRHHLDPASALASYDNDHGQLQQVYRTSLRDTAPILTTLDERLATPTALSAREFSDLMAFLAAQTDPKATSSAVLTIPGEVPSGLPIDR